METLVAGGTWQPGDTLIRTRSGLAGESKDRVVDDSGIR